MEYDPIKRQLGTIFKKNPFLRKVFYRLLDLLLLRSWHIRKALNETFPHGKDEKLKILDAGSGFGQYSYRIAQKYPYAEILGIDLKEEQIEDCNLFFDKIRKSNKVKFKTADLTEFILCDYYDLILSVDVMEHIEEDEKVFFNLNQSLKSGGVLLISTPSDQGGSDVEDHHEESAHGFIEEHVRDGYSIADITEKLLRTGFSKVEAKYTYGKAGSSSWRLSMKYPIQMLGISKIFYLILPFYYLLTFPLCLLLNYIDVNNANLSGTGLIVKATK